MNNQYFLLRHGETDYQIRKRDLTYPWPDKPPVRLTKRGQKEIKKVAKKLKTRKIDLIYSSDIFRAKRTAEIVAKELGFKINPVRKRGFLNGINFDKRLRDVNLGIFHNKPKETDKTKGGFYAIFPDPKERFSKRPSGGESWNDVKKRVVNFIKEIDKKYKNKTILIVGHGDPLWLLEGAVKGLTSQECLNEIFVKKNYIKVGELRKI